MPIRNSNSEAAALTDEITPSSLDVALTRLAALGVWDADNRCALVSPELDPIDSLSSILLEITAPRRFAGPLPFRFWQCEALIGEAIDHLNHCVSERQQYDDLRGRFSALVLSVEAFVHDDDVTRREQNSEQRTLNRCILTDTQIRLTEETANIRSAEDDLRRHINDPEGPWNVDQRAEQQAQLTRSSYFSSYISTHNSSISGSPKGYTIFIKNLGIPTEPEAAFEIETHQLVPYWVYDKSLALNKLDLNSAKFARDRDLALLGEQKASLTLQSDNLAKEISFFDEAVIFEDQHVEARRAAMSSQITEMTRAGGTYNYIEQMRAVRLRFLTHLADVVARLVPLADGMKQIYGFPLALPDPTVANEREYSYLDLVIAWIQLAASFLTRFNKRDQVTDVVVSIRTIVNQEWETIASTSRPKFLISLPVGLFEDMYYPRLRGIALFVVPRANVLLRGTFAARISVPRKGSTLFFPEGSLPIVSYPRVVVGSIVIPPNPVKPWSEAEELYAIAGEKNITQSTAPSARSARIGLRESVAGYDVVGTAVWANLSPIGSGDADEKVWSIEIDRLSSQGEVFSETITDLEFEIHVAYQDTLPTSEEGIK